MSARETSRRTFVMGAAFTPAMGALAVPVLASTSSPLQQLYRQWEANLDAAKAAYEAIKGEDHEREDDIFAAYAPERHAIEQAIAAEPVTSLTDLAVKVIVLTGEGSFGLPDATVLECAKIVGRDFDKLPRCLFEGEV